MNRRRLLQVGTASLLIGGALPACSGSKAASAPWQVSPEQYEDPRLNVLAYAVLAPSPHNRQPWLVELQDDDPDLMILYPDLDRLLPETDPPNRQITIGLGAFIEAASLAASQIGRRLSVSPFPEGSNADALSGDPVAIMRFDEEGTGRPDPLFDYLPTRRTNRTVFDDRTPPKDDLLALGTALSSPISFWGASTSPNFCQSIREICKRAWRTEVTTPRTHLESVNLTRIGRREVEDNPDGISLQGGMMEVYAGLGILDRDAMKDPDSRAFNGTLDFYESLIDSALGFAWLGTEDDSRTAQLEAGRDWMRTHLAATRAGLAFHPLSQPLQEFPEMVEHYSAIHEVIGVTNPARLQGLFRIGYAKDVSPSPRWPLRTRLIDVS